MHGRVATSFIAGLLAAAAPARADVPAGNLLVNPGAEASPGTAAGWTTTGSFAAGVYGQDGFLPAPPDGGANLFWGGDAPDPATGASTASQTIDVTRAAAEIDAGTVTAGLSALLGGFSSQQDHASVTLRFLGADGETGQALTIGPVTDTDRGDVTAMLPRAGSAAVPAGTRALSVTITSTRFAGTDDDGYADNVSLSLAGPPPPVIRPAPTPTPVATVIPAQVPAPVFHRSVVVQPTGTVRVKRPGGGFVTLTGAAQIPLGSTVDTTHGAVTLSSVPKPGAGAQKARFYSGVFEVTQPGGITDLKLTEPLASCRKASAAKRTPKTRKLWGDGSGAFRTSGQYSSATVRGTQWLVQDSCAGTLTRVVRGVVAVNDRVHHKRIVLRAGKRYLARPRAR